MNRQTALKFVKVAAQAADEKLGQDIVALDVRPLTSVTDCFLFISATSHIHVRALEDEIRTKLGEAGAVLRRTDGQRGHLWRALDYGSLIVHIMDQKSREFYAIERLWNEGKRIPIRPVPAKRASKTRSSIKTAAKK